MKKNKKGLHFWLKKNAGNQILIIGIWLGITSGLILAAGAFLNFILGKIILSITTASVGAAILNYTWWIILIICLGICIYSASRTIYKSRVIVEERNVALLECFSKFVGEDYENIDESQGVIHEGLHFVFPYFSIFKIHNNVTYFLGDMGIKLFEDVNRKTDFPVDVKDTSVNLAATVFVKIINPIFTAYNVDNYQGYIVKKCEAALRKKCMEYNLEGLLESKKDLNLEQIFPDLGSSGSSSEIDKIEKDFGVQILEFIVTDIGVQEKDLVQKEKIIQAENEKKATKIQNEILLAKEETQAELVKIKTKSEADRIEKLATAKANELKTINGAIAENLKETTNAEAESLVNFKNNTGFDNNDILARDWNRTTGSNGKNIFIHGDNNGVANLGAQFATGANAVNQKEKEA